MSHNIGNDDFVVGSDCYGGCGSLSSPCGIGKGQNCHNHNNEDFTVGENQYWPVLTLSRQ